MEFSPLEITLLILAPMIIAFYVGFSRGEGVGVEKNNQHLCSFEHGRGN